jgi:hypothetical protein
MMEGENRQEFEESSNSAKPRPPEEFIISDYCPKLLLRNLTVSENVLYYGAFGELYEAELLGAPCSARITMRNLKNEKVLNTFVLWSGLKHPSIVMLLGLFVKDDVTWMVTEEIDVNLLDLLESYPRSELPLSVKSTVLYDVSCALCYLHSLDPPLPFEDLKADHVFVTADLRGKLDLGVKITGSKFHTYLNTFESYDPAVSYHVPSDFICRMSTPGLVEDVQEMQPLWAAFSFGVLCLHTLIHEVPIPTSQTIEECLSDSRMVFLHTEEELRWSYILKLREKEKLFLPLIKSCLGTVPKERPSLDTICQELSHLSNSLGARQVRGLHNLTEAIEYAEHDITKTSKNILDIQDRLCHLLALPKDYPIQVPNSPVLVSHRPRSQVISGTDFDRYSPTRTRKEIDKTFSLPRHYRDSKQGKHQLFANTKWKNLPSVSEDADDDSSDDNDNEPSSQQEPQVFDFVPEKVMQRKGKIPTSEMHSNPTQSPHGSVRVGMTDKAANTGGGVVGGVVRPSNVVDDSGPVGNSPSEDVIKRRRKLSGIAMLPNPGYMYGKTGAVAYDYVHLPPDWAPKNWKPVSHKDLF